MASLYRAIAFLLIGVGMLVQHASADTTIIIVRHGEKPAQGLGQLSCKGLNRALSLPAVLLSRYGNPSAIFAPNPAVKKIDKGVAYAYVRPLATIEPLAIQSGLPVNVDWGMEETDKLSERLLAQTEGTFVVAWEHHYAEKLARQLILALHGNPAEIPAWNDADFDSIYIIQFAGDAKGARQATFRHEYQGLNDVPSACDNMTHSQAGSH
jgi:hypothetical protein